MTRAASVQASLDGERRPSASPENRPAALEQVAPNLAPPPGNPRFPLFDSLRAIAALSVFLGHTITGTVSIGRHPTLFIMAVQLADEGVAIFFLISGFLLYRPFLVARKAERPFSVPAFARRRLLRIVPAYWVALSLFIVLGLAGGVSTHNWWIFYGFAQIYSLSTIGHGIGAAWTLCIEMTFYASLPVFAFLAARLARGQRSVRGDVVLLVALSLASLVFRGHFNSFADYATVDTLPGTFLWFALGMGLAVASVRHHGQIEAARATRFVTEHPTPFWLAAAAGSGLLYWASRMSQSVAIHLITHVLYGIVALCVLLPGVFGDEAGGMARTVLRRRTLAWIGLVSYSFYLYHTVVISEIHKITSFYPAVLVLSGLVAVTCSAASYYVVERPMMRLRQLPLVPALRARRLRNAVGEHAAKLD